MKHAVAVFKLLQLAGGTGLVFAPFFIRQAMMSESIGMFVLGCAIVSLLSGILLAALGEWSRAWKGTLLIVALAAFAAVAGAPKVIR